MIGLLMMLAAAGADADPRCAAAQIGQPLRAVLDDVDTARQIALVYLTRFFGAETIKSELPLRVFLYDGVWRVRGKELRSPSIGGVVEIDLCQSSGQVLWLNRGD